MSKRLIVCCDGTWNTPDQSAPTNVTKIALAIAPRDAEGREQRSFYQPGVGTNRFERIRGGAFGFGLSRDIRSIYHFLIMNYEPGDELFFFGFSRGAYMARSTAGLIRKCGILRRENADRIGQAYALYRKRGNNNHPSSIEAELFRRSYSHQPSIRFIGVWDTVGSLGIPLSGTRLVNLLNKRWQFHDTTLSSTVKSAFHALSIDEQRKPFQPAIWEQSAEVAKQPPEDRQVLEQVWFAGDHSDVGGGHLDPSLAEIPLLWMADRAYGCGLEFESDAFAPLVSGGASRANGKFVAPDPLGRLHRRSLFFRLLRPYVRPMGVTARKHEWAASSAVDRQKSADYTPSNLADFLKTAPGRIKPVALALQRRERAAVNLVTTSGNGVDQLIELG